MERTTSDGASPIEPNPHTESANPIVGTQMEGAVAVLTMQYPPHNLFDLALTRAVIDALAWARGQGARAVVLNSAMRHFSAGADLKAIENGLGEDGGQLLLELLGAFREHPAPIIASVHGVCVGGGLEIALACDFVIAAESSKLGCVEPIVGLHPLMGAIQRISQRAGELRAKEMAMFGRRFDAQTLERWNIINRVVPDARLASATMVLARELAAGPTVAHAATKKLAAVAASQGVEAADKAMLEIQKAVFASRDFANAVASYRERGPGFAMFEGR
ncbi:MAG: enoyl-CoA hydratase/isomerase family protein [Bradyrhizobium sp.]|jgi:enoyl-CoA hydratase/carnithine racemase|nr:MULTISPECIES: enoyl-CoA hydratase/isomerase family protein [Bradyrhizobium]ABQ34774.1 putative enoyl-CoA hydratase [Bradyrhizobium sp. BTAi1]MDU0956308.1 enoyl-CoA hydratase/isomerase family protein [Bradyrhizobium sp.]MDU1492657.1 enoyl-CoA hydratase/isomerase family protein [Bradyrhizobium sp.]MDU1542808.1 enoyl-CoA hydratase/isomerase family protein [Bradyrhizobium sp.]MDU1688126.1 enoyl-CoA hydratase/isomerase family protein [Bradyrhizobium sp.]